MEKSLRGIIDTRFADICENEDPQMTYRPGVSMCQEPIEERFWKHALNTQLLL